MSMGRWQADRVGFLRRYRLRYPQQSNDRTLALLAHEVGRMWGRPMPGELCKGTGPGEIDLDSLSIRQLARRHGRPASRWAAGEGAWTISGRGEGPIMTTHLLRVYRSLPGHLGAV